MIALLLRGARVTGSADWLYFRNTVLDGRQGREWRVRLGLIPVCYRIKVVRTMIGMTVLDRGSNGFRERDGRVEMKPVQRPAPAGALFTFDRCSVHAV